MILAIFALVFYIILALEWTNRFVAKSEWVHQHYIVEQRSLVGLYRNIIVLPGIWLAVMAYLTWCYGNHDELELI